MTFSLRFADRIQELERRSFIGIWTEVINSFERIAVFFTPVMKSSIGIERSPWLLCKLTLAESAMSGGAVSAAGEPLARFAPIVPRLRIWYVPTCDAASLKAPA